MIHCCILLDFSFFCMNFTNNLFPLLITVYIVIVNCKHSVVQNKFLPSYCLRRPFWFATSSGSFIIVFARLMIFKLSVPISDMWQPKYAFDIHLCYLVVITVKIFLTQNRIALWISYGSGFSKQTCNFTAIYSLNGMEIDCCAICFPTRNKSNTFCRKWSGWSTQNEAVDQDKMKQLVNTKRRGWSTQKSQIR